MAKYLFVYHGGGKPGSEAEIAEVMEAWGQWLASIANDVVAGGNPVGLSTTVNSDGSITSDGGPNPVSGYSVIDASNTEDAVEKAQRCPILASGGSVELAEVIDM